MVAANPGALGDANRKSTLSPLEIERLVKKNGTKDNLTKHNPPLTHTAQR